MFQTRTITFTTATSTKMMSFQASRPCQRTVATFFSRFEFVSPIGYFVIFFRSFFAIDCEREVSTDELGHGVDVGGHGRVLRLDSLSKFVAPGMRIGEKTY